MKTILHRYRMQELLSMQGTYDILFYVEDTTGKYLPFMYNDVVVLPDTTQALQTVNMNKWIKSLQASINGKIINAFNGYSVEGATIMLRPGWNKKDGSYATIGLTKIPRTAVSDTNGCFNIVAPTGAYTAEVTKDGYVIAYYNVITSNTGPISMSITPVLSDDEYRIVLTWGATPSDLDSHLTYFKDGVQQFHVYYGNKTGYVGGRKVASLDVDDVNSYGPETVTITASASLVQSGELRYSVHNYSGNYDGLASSNATVQVYQGNELKDTYRVLQNQNNLTWHVFKNTENGIIPVNAFDNAGY